MAKNKATHQGTCQVCGRLQMLPAGVLSKHGYTKQFGFFNGVCWGAGSKPFEQAYDLLEKSITLVTTQRDALVTCIAELEAAPITNQAPYYRYVRGNGYIRSSYQEQMVTLTVGENGRVDSAVFADGETAPAIRYSLTGTLEEVVTRLRANRITRYKKDIADREGYISWQQKRVDTWKPQPLTPVKTVKY